MTTGTAELCDLERTTAAPDRRPARAVGRHRVTLLLLAATLSLGVLGPLLLSWKTGSLHIPHNDTWAFSRSAEIFTRTGHIRLFNWNAVALIGAFVPLGPLGRSIATQQCAIALLSLITLGAAFDVLRPVTGSRRAALGLLVLVIWPCYGLLSTSLMTDIPAFAATTLTLAVGRRAVQRASTPLFALTGLIGLWGFTVREQTITATFAVLGAALLRPRLRERALLIRFAVILLVLGAAAAVFELWRRSLPNGSSPTFSRISFPGMDCVIATSLGGLLPARPGRQPSGLPGRPPLHVVRDLAAVVEEDPDRLRGRRGLVRRPVPGELSPDPGLLRAGLPRQPPRRRPAERLGPAPTRWPASRPRCWWGSSSNAAGGYRRNSGSSSL